MNLHVFQKRFKRIDVLVSLPTKIPNGRKHLAWFVTSTLAMILALVVYIYSNKYVTKIHNASVSCNLLFIFFFQYHVLSIWSCIAFTFLVLSGRYAPIF
jgi:hypothetical protein